VSGHLTGIEAAKLGRIFDHETFELLLPPLRYLSFQTRGSLRKLSILSVFLIWCGSVTSQSPVKHLIGVTEIRQEFYEGLGRMYDFDFSGAAARADYLGSHWPASPWSYILQANVCWWKMITGEDNATERKRFQQALKTAGEKLTAANTDENLFCRIVIQSLQARYELLQRNYPAALLILKRSDNLPALAEGKQDEYEPFLLTQGLFQYFLAAAKEKSGLLSFLIRQDADKQKGLECLLQLSRSEDLVLRTEGNYFLMKIFLEMEDNPRKAQTFSHYLVNQHPDNLIFRYYDCLISRQLQQLAGEPPSGCGGIPADQVKLSVRQRMYLNALLEQNN